MNDMKMSNMQYCGIGILVPETHVIIPDYVIYPAVQPSLEGRL